MIYVNWKSLDCVVTPVCKFWKLYILVWAKLAMYRIYKVKLKKDMQTPCCFPKAAYIHI